MNDFTGPFFTKITFEFREIHSSFNENLTCDSVIETG